MKLNPNSSLTALQRVQELSGAITTQIAFMRVTNGKTTLREILKRNYANGGPVILKESHWVTVKCSTLKQYWSNKSFKAVSGS